MAEVTGSSPVVSKGVQKPVFGSFLGNDRLFVERFLCIYGLEKLESLEGVRNGKNLYLPGCIYDQHSGS